MLKYAPMLLVFAAGPAFAQTAPPAQSQVAETKLDPLDKVVCRTEETVGSRLKKHKVCATVREWQEQQQENREALELYQQRGQSTVPSG